MGRLAIIEDDSCPANSIAAAASSRQVQTSSDKSESKTTTKASSPAAENATGSGTPNENGTTKQEVSTSSGTQQRCCKKKSQGGAGSDESGYYEGDELQGDDSIEIVYDRCLAKNSDRIRIHQNAVSAIKNGTGLPVLPTSTTGGVSITPIPVSTLSTVHQPTSSNNLVQGGAQNVTVNPTSIGSNKAVLGGGVSTVTSTAEHLPSKSCKNSNFAGCQVSMDDFDLLKVLGTGAYGKVFLARKKTGANSGQLFAMKVLKKATIVQKRKTTEHTKTERQVLATIRQSPFLVTMHYAFQTPSKLHLVLDYINGGELFTHLYQREKFTENEVRIYIGEIVLALEHLHKNGIIYRDIKLENILLDGEGHIVLTDFGLSREFQPDDSVRRATSFCGTIEYMAPEVVKGGGHDIAVDWWSLGVLTYELLTGASPFTVEGDRNTQPDISKRILNLEPMMPDFLNPDVKDFILRLLVKDPRKRLGGGPLDAEEVKRHKFFTSINWDDLLKRNIPAPFIPRISSTTDVSNFSEEFTSMPAVDTPSVVPPNVEDVFQGYSFVAPSVLFAENNVISEDLFRPNPDKKPSTSNLVGCKLMNSPFFQRYDLDLKEAILGDGSFSVCRRCVDRLSGKEFAVKIVSKRVDCSTEIRLLKQCQGHPNVVQLIDVLQDDAHTYIVMEYLKGGELLQRIRKKKKFSEAEAAKIMKKLVSVVQFMHYKGVVHRDLKPENLLFADDSDEAELKVVDFGFACLKPKDESCLMRTACFTLQYAAPEVIDQGLPQTSCSANGYNESCDIWSIGVILYTMVSGRSPFLGSHNKPENPKHNESDTVASIIRRIKHGDFRMDGDAWKYVSHAAKLTIKGLLTVDVKKRLTMDALVSSSWINNSYAGNNNNNPPSLLMTPLVLNEPPSAYQVIDRNLKQTFNAYHTVARELTLASMSNHHCLLGGNHRSSSISSSSSSLSSGGASSISSSGAIRASNNNTKTVQEYLQQHAQHQQQFLQQQAASASASNSSSAQLSLGSSSSQPQILPSNCPVSVSIAPLMSAAEAAFSGVSYQLMPVSSSSSNYFQQQAANIITNSATLGHLSPVSSSSSLQLSPTGSHHSLISPSSGSGGGSPSVSITKMGPMTRSRKRKMQDISSVSITPTFNPGGTASPTKLSNNSAANLEIVTVTKRDRTTNDLVFPAAASTSSRIQGSNPGTGLQYCATARAVVVTAAKPSVQVTSTATWTPTVNGGIRTHDPTAAAIIASTGGSNSRSVTITID